MSAQASWRSFFTTLAVVGAVTLLVVAVLAGSCVWAFSSAFDDITDPQQYPTLRSNLGASAQHFPLSLPAAAQNVKLNYTPGFGQGASELQVRYTLPSASAAALASSMPVETAIDRFSEDFVLNTSVGFLRVPGKATPRLRDLTGRYSIFIHYASGNWNHPNVGAVLIDVDTGDVIYVAIDG